jgi:hypothetical protein
MYFPAFLGFIQGFVDWPLIVTCVRWLFKWFEEAPSRKLPQLLYYILFIIAIIWAQLIQITIVATFSHIEMSTVSNMSPIKPYLIGRLCGLVSHVLLLAFTHRYVNKPKAK